MILLDAVYINMGGGKVLLDHLMTELENTNEKVFYLLDDRVQNNHIPVKQTNKVQFIKAGFVQRARFYKNNKNSFSSILCFGNYPPLYKTSAKVFTYFHQSLFLELPEDLSLKQKWVYGLKALILKIKIQNTDYWMVQSDKIKNALAKKFKISENKILEMPFYPRLPDTKQVDKIENTYTYIGDAFVSKNHRILIEAFSEFYQKFHKGELILTISTREKEIIDLIADKQMKNIPIKNVGMVDRTKVSEILQCAEYVVYPSLAESFGLSIIEAIEKDCKIIGADLPYMHAACEPSLLFNPCDKKSLVEALSLSLQKDIKKSTSKIPNKIFEIINLLTHHANQR